MIGIKIYEPNDNADFYIQSVGYNSGRPTRKPLKNCFSVYTNDLRAFTITNALFSAKKFKGALIGSKTPRLRLQDVRHILLTELDKNHNLNEFYPLGLIDLQIENAIKKVKSLKRLKIFFSLKALRARV